MLLLAGRQAQEQAGRAAGGHAPGKDPWPRATPGPGRVTRPRSPGTCEKLGLQSLAALWDLLLLGQATCTPQHPPPLNSESCLDSLEPRRTQRPRSQRTWRTGEGHWLPCSHGHLRSHVPAQRWHGWRGKPSLPHLALLSSPCTPSPPLPPTFLSPLPAGSLGASKLWVHVEVIRPEGRGWRPVPEPVPHGHFEVHSDVGRAGHRETPGQPRPAGWGLQPPSSCRLRHSQGRPCLEVLLLSSQSVINDVS